ncbi:hypothetical protein BST61_g415 [Cercospora zeina]
MLDRASCKLAGPGRARLSKDALDAVHLAEAEEDSISPDESRDEHDGLRIASSGTSSPRRRIHAHLHETARTRTQPSITCGTTHMSQFSRTSKPPNDLARGYTDRTMRAGKDDDVNRSRLVQVWYV